MDIEDSITSTRTSHLLMEISLSIICVFGVTLNATVIRNYARRRSMSGVRWLAMVWAFLNLIFMCTTPLLVLTIHQGHWPAGHAMCKLYMAVVTMGQWSCAWLLVTATWQLLPVLCCYPGKNWLIPTIILIVTAPTCFILVNTELVVENDHTRHCTLPLSSFEAHVWVTVVGYLFTYHTPLIISLCYLVITFQLGKDRGFPSTWKRVFWLHVSLMLAHLTFWALYWVSQIQLFIDIAGISNLIVHGLANILFHVHLAIVVPLILLTLSHQTSRLSRLDSGNHGGAPPTSGAASNKDEDSQENLLMDTSRRSSFNVLDSRVASPSVPI